MAKHKTYHEQLSLIEDAIRQGQELDVSKLKTFLLKSANVPLYCVGSGGFGLSMLFCAQLYQANRGMAEAKTPLLMNYVSDETLKNCKVFVYSKGGSQIDTGFICDRMIEHNPKGLFVLGQFRRGKHPNTMINHVRKHTDNWLLWDWHADDGFTSVLSPLVMATAIYRVFCSDWPLDRLKIDSSPFFNYHTKGYTDKPLPEFKNIKTFIALYGGWGYPVAYTFESMLVESGIADVQLCDLRNWCHGRFIYLSNHIEDSAIVLFLTPREKRYAERLFDARDFHNKDKKVFPDNILMVEVESEFDEPIATIDLAVKTCHLIDEISLSYGSDPNSPINLSGIDKRVPRPLKMIEQKEDGAVNLNGGIVGTLKGVSQKTVIDYNPKLSVEKNAEKNNVSVAMIRKYIRENNIDRNRDNKLKQFLAVREILEKNPTATAYAIGKKLGCSPNTAKKYMEMTEFAEELEKGKVSLVHYDAR